MWSLIPVSFWFQGSIHPIVRWSIPRMRARAFLHRCLSRAGATAHACIPTKRGPIAWQSEAYRATCPRFYVRAAGAGALCSLLGAEMDRRQSPERVKRANPGVTEHVWCRYPDCKLFTCRFCSAWLSNKHVFSCHRFKLPKRGDE